MLSRVLRVLRSISLAFKESKVSAQTEEYVLEHFLLYHGLAGSRPDDERQLEDVRADIRQALQAGDSAQLEIAFKLAPLSWSERLETICLDLAVDYSAAGLRRLISGISEPGQAQSAAGQRLLASSDWRVRANAALVLACLPGGGCGEALARSLDECRSDPLKPAFCHVIYALGREGSRFALETVAEHLNSDEPWFRVDAARALALWPLDKVEAALVGAILSCHQLSDYTAVAAARLKPAVQLLNANDQRTRQAGLELIAGVLEAASQTFRADIVLETGIYKTWPLLKKHVQGSNSPRLLRASLLMAGWLVENADMLPDSGSAGMHIDETGSPAELKAQAKDFLAAQPSVSTIEAVVAVLERFSQPTSMPGEIDTGELRHALRLCVQLSIEKATASLEKLLHLESPLLEEVIHAVGQTARPLPEARLIELAKRLVDGMTPPAWQADEQTGRQEEAARSYLAILKALKRAASSEALAFLIEASADLAPERGQQALESMIDVAVGRRQQSLSTEPDRAEIERTLARALRDSSVEACLQAVAGAAALDFPGLLPEVARHLDSQAASLRQAASSALAQAATLGHKDEVRGLIKGKIAWQFNRFRRKHLRDLLSRLQ